MTGNTFNDTIKTWINALQLYSYEQLCSKPAPQSWSLGQVYMHLLHDTAYYIEQVKICASNNDYADERAAAMAQTMFANNAFPDKQLAGPPESPPPPPPASKEQLLSSLLSLNKEINNAATLIATTKFKGKTRHPGFEYFDAAEWFHFAEMHFRHHLRQKQRLESFLQQGI